MAAATKCLLLFFVVAPQVITAASRSLSFLSKGSHLAVANNDALVSPDRTFACGFYGTGANAFWFSIWFANSADRAVVWTANRDQPVNGVGSRVSLRETGALVLTDVDGATVWLTTASSAGDVDSAELLDTGNLVLKDSTGRVLWQSFDSPTNTLLPGQRFTKTQKLTSALGPGQLASGYHSLAYGYDNVLRMVYDGPEVSSPYWPDPDYANGETNANSTRLAVLDHAGTFTSSDGLVVDASDLGRRLKRRLTLDTDGNLRMYSLDNGTGTWSVSWQAVRALCKIHGVCGRFGVCIYGPVPKCSCPIGYQVINPLNWNQGCQPMFNLTCSSTGASWSEEVMFVPLPNTDYYGNDIQFLPRVTLETCRTKCVENCNCRGFNYRRNGDGTCFLKSALFNGFSSPDVLGNIYLKLPRNFEDEDGVGSESDPFKASHGACAVSVERTVSVGSLSMYDLSSSGFDWRYPYGFVLVFGAMEVVCMAAGFFFLLSARRKVRYVDDEYSAVAAGEFRHFSYAELKKATGNFKMELGRGGSGAVYKGVLQDGRVAAVKRLGDVVEGEEVLWAEVRTIGNINHMNLVRMWGFCFEKKHKLLVYEHVENSSLDRHLFPTEPSSSPPLEWAERFKAAVGTAKGLAYLHHECLEWVIHCDVKPENILLDREFEPKIADFGLAKLWKRDEESSEFSCIRGTKGYMAPEWALNQPITAKVDVYSFGVVVLELVRGVRLSDWVVTEDESGREAEMTRFVREAKVKIRDGVAVESWIDGVVDPRLRGAYSKKQAMGMVLVGLSCVDNDSSKRPTMDVALQHLLQCDDL
uniref:Receptor-like serine/threonine-protein kinase n=1 Tax=Kalanchoe fedtschenkoi TaxID=63787 RepID=A0A7N0UDR8_KALFE